MATPADSVYELQVYDLADDDNVVEWVVGFALTPLTGGEPLMMQRQELRIVDPATGVVLAQWRLSGSEANQMRLKIEAELREMDAETFAEEWGLHPEDTDATGDE